MTTSTQPREEVFPGYLLTERIGSGGYAEVWRARAPGGIDKAVKIVYGWYDDQLASQEMKALERIKDVRHPFVLSLERFEVVDGRLAILTELADMSLEQRAQQCRAQGLPGIPRDELLRFLSDAAEALDYLSQRHSLQHLDIKPANLLISGNHVKVADFGLVKELASRTQNSMVAGMTPTYSSPEMFDDAPSPHSDQYSLAIVYQEMLTGVLPFPGRTAAQLANQHLRSQPQLAALAEMDRPAIARALAKNPAERFPTCSAFMKALIEAANPLANRATVADKATEQPGIAPHESSSPRVVTMPRRLDGVSPAKSSPSPTATQPTEAQPHGTIDTKAELKPAAKSWPKEEIADVPVPPLASATEATHPTLYIALGGVGIRILCRLRESLARRANVSQPSTALEMIAIDTDRDELRDACSTKWSNPLPSADALCLPLRLPKEYREQGRGSFEWLSHRWLYNIPRSLETRGYRPLGRLALVDRLDEALSLIDRKLKQLAAAAGDKDRRESTAIRVVLLVGMGGGTGGGMAIDFANAARSRIHALERRALLESVFVCTCLGNATVSPLSVANTYALLTELQFVSLFGNQGTQSEASGLQPLESGERPFDLVYCVPARRHSSDSVDDGLSWIASHLALASTDDVRQILQSCQQTATPRELREQGPLLLRTFGSASLAAPKANQIDPAAEIEQMPAEPPSETAIAACVVENECVAAVEELPSRDEEPAITDCIVENECVAAVEELPCLDAADVPDHSALMTLADAQQALDGAEVDLLQCGYDRRTLIVVPSNETTRDAIAALTQARPTVAVVSADVVESVIVCEGAGISPSSLARGLERVYPGVSEAARRRFTRIDIDWSAWSS